MCLTGKQQKLEKFSLHSNDFLWKRCHVLILRRTVKPSSRLLTFVDPLGIRKEFWALMKLEVSAKSEVVALLLSIAEADLTLSFVGAAFVVFFAAFAAGAAVSAVFPVFCFWICLHFARLFLNQTFRDENECQKSTGIGVVAETNQMLICHCLRHLPFRSESKSKREKFTVVYGCICAGAFWSRKLWFVTFLTRDMELNNFSFSSRFKSCCFVIIFWQNQFPLPLDFSPEPSTPADWSSSRPLRAWICLDSASCGTSTRGCQAAPSSTLSAPAAASFHCLQCTRRGINSDCPQDE